MKKPTILYHGTTSRLLPSLIRDMALKPRTINPKMNPEYMVLTCSSSDGVETFGHGPYGRPTCVYLTDLWALSYANCNYDDPVIVEVEIPKWVWGFRRDDGTLQCLAYPDITWHTLNHHPSLTWEELNIHRDVYVPHDELEHSWEESFKHFGSIGVFLPRYQTLQIKRILHIDRKKAPYKLLLHMDFIKPALDYPETVKQELKETHSYLFEKCKEADWATVYEGDCSSCLGIRTMEI
jgi:hypothetical protein